MIYLSCQDKAPYTNRSRFMIVDRGERKGKIKIVHRFLPGIQEATARSTFEIPYERA